MNLGFMGAYLEQTNSTTSVLETGRPGGRREEEETGRPGGRREEEETGREEARARVEKLQK